MSDTAAPSQPYRVLARKYRPTDFSALIGQEAMVRTLTNAFATGRIAQAYMLTGVRGVGKTTTARLIARALNYPDGPAIDMPVMTPTCEAILESRHMDVIEMDAASNTGVDNMREVIDSVRYAPAQARVKVYIIDEVHMLSKSAFNALLKTLEEPPPHVKFIFATTEIRKVPVTILSRCQRFDLRRLDAAVLAEHYGRIAKAEGVEAEDEALKLIARAAEGSVRDGLSLLDQAISHGQGQVKAEDVTAMLGLVDRGRTIDLFEAIMGGDAARALALVQEQFAHGAAPETVLVDLADFVHWVTRLRLVREESLRDNARSEAERVRGVELAGKLGMAALTRAWQMLLKGLPETSVAPNPEQAAEMVLIRLAHGLDLPPTDELLRIARSRNVEKMPQRPAPLKAEGTAPASQGQLAPAVARAEAVAPPQATAAAPTAFADYAGLIKLVAEKRDIKLKGELERHVRPIAMRDGKLEFALEPNAPPGLANELVRKLEAWTGRRQIISVARDGGDEPLLKQKKSRQALVMQEAMEDATVKAVLRLFPKAEIIEVREPELSPNPTTEDANSQEETDEEPR
jgi:DNA polymerase-3 subunit gamma/tau